MKDYIEKLNWRYATKRFSNEKISDENLTSLKEAMRLSASSYGLQPYEIFIIEDNSLREKLKPAAYNQPQITEASQLVVFASYASVSEADIDKYIQNIATTRNTSVENLKQFSDTIKNTILPQSEEQQAIWTAKQTYIVLGNLLSAAANLKIDACPMEGFDNQKFDEILNLKEKGLKTAVIATLGYRHEEDQTQHLKKVRKSTQELFNTI